MNMIWLLVITTFIFLTVALYFYYAYYIRPVKISNWYRNTLEAMGYKVLSFPYHPFKIMLVQNQRYHEKSNGDAFYDEKHTWFNYDIVISNTSNQITLVLISPKLIKHFFSPEKLYLFPKSHINKQGFKLVLGNTMILNQGDIWKRKRIIFSDIFNFDFVSRNIPKMKNIVDEGLRQAEQQANIIQQNQTNQVYKLQLKSIFENIISNILIKCFFGAEGVNHKIDGLPINKYLSLILKDARDQSTDPIVLLLGETAYKWNIKSKYKDLNCRITKLKQEVKCIISQKLQKIKQQNNDKYTDILQALWFLKKSNTSGIYSIQQNQIIEQFCAFLTAGNESTSFFMNMIIFYIVQNPEVQTKLRQQIHKHIRNINDVSFENLKKINYLQWIQLQTSRMYGPATNILLREAAQDTFIDNIPILKGTGLKIQLLGNHYNEKYFTQPFKFKPERWSKFTEISPYTFGGFSYGPRTCIGKQLAYLSTKIITVLLLLRYNSIEIDKNQKIVFQVKSFYTPSNFISTLTKLKES